MRNQELRLALVALWPNDASQFTWRNTRIGVTVWSKHRESWRPRQVIYRGREYIIVTLTNREERARYARRQHAELHCRVLAPRLAILPERTS